MRRRFERSARGEESGAGRSFAFILGLVGLQRIFAIGNQTGPPAIKIEIQGRKVAIWKPVGVPPPDGYPVILFSHGFTSCDTQSSFLTAALAQAGYFVLAADHHDAAWVVRIASRAFFRDLPIPALSNPFTNPKPGATQLSEPARRPGSHPGYDPQGKVIPGTPD